MRAVLVFLLLAGCSTVTPPGSTALELLDDATAAAKGVIPDAQLIVVQSAEAAYADGRAERWVYAFNGSSGGVTVTAGAGETFWEANNGFYGVNQTAIQGWSIDSDEAMLLAKDYGFQPNETFLQLSLTMLDEPWWTFLSNELIFVNAMDGRVATTLFVNRDPPASDPVSSSDQFAQSLTPVSSSFEVNFESPSLYANYTRTSPGVQTYTVTLEGPGNSTSRFHTAEAQDFFELFLGAPRQGTYYLNMTGPAGTPAFDIGWCATGFNAQTREATPC